MRIAPGTPRDEAERLLQHWRNQFDSFSPGNSKPKGLNWDYGAYGGSGFGGKDIDEMKRREFSPYQIRAAYDEARERGLNVGPRAEQEASSIPRQPKGLPDARSHAWGERWPGDGGPIYRAEHTPWRPSSPGQQPPGLIPEKPTFPNSVGKSSPGDGRSWSFDAHGGAGFGGADFKAMRSGGYSDDHIRNAIGEARRQGRNVGRRVQQWESGGGPWQR